MKKLYIFLFTLIAFSASAQNLGIGIPNPLQKLDVLGNIQFSGALMPAGNAGNVNDALISSGAGVAPTWGNPTSGQTWTTKYSTDSVLLSIVGPPYILIPGLTATFTVPSVGTFDLFVFSDGAGQWTGNNAADGLGIQTDISFWLDGVAVRYITLNIDNTSNFGKGLRNYAFCYSQPIAAGSHTVEVKVTIRTLFSGPLGVTFGDPNVLGENRICSLSYCLLRK